MELRKHTTYIYSERGLLWGYGRVFYILSRVDIQFGTSSFRKYTIYPCEQ